MPSFLMIICMVALAQCQYDGPAIETSQAGYEEAEKNMVPEAIPSGYGMGEDQLKYSEEMKPEVFEQFDQVFEVFKEYVRHNNYGTTPKDIEYASRLDQIQVEWKESIGQAPQGVQHDFASTLNNIVKIITSKQTIRLFNSLVDLWKTFSNTFFKVSNDMPVGVHIPKPDWQVDFELAIQEEEVQGNSLRRHRRNTMNNEIMDSDFESQFFARQTTKKVATTRATARPIATTRRTTTRKAVVTTTRKPVATTRKTVATKTYSVPTTRKPVATTKKPVATTRKPVATTKKPVATTRKGGNSQTANQNVGQEQNVDVDNGVHETYIKAARIINVFIDDDQPAEMIAQAVAAQFFEYEKADPNP